MSKFTIFSSFWLKVLALLFMALDHVGLAIISFFPYTRGIAEVSNVLRGFGRLAMPLFVFMIVEGVIHTKNIKKYLLRLGIMAAIISIFLIIITYVKFDFDTDLTVLTGAGNIFLDLLLIAVAIFLLKQENNYLKLLILLPIGISFMSFFAKAYEFATGDAVLWYPNWLYLQYDWLSMLLGVGFYLSYKFSDLYIELTTAKNGMDKSVWEANGNYRFLVNLVSILILIVVSVIYYLFRYIWPQGTFWDASLQLLAVFSGAFILLYNGKRGYNAKWFQYGSYLFYPVHLIIIVGICILISGGL